MDALQELFSRTLGFGLESQQLNSLQTVLRAVVIYAAVVIVVRLGKKRFMGRATAFDVILGIMIGSIASRAVTGNAPFIPAIAATAALIGIHWVASAIAVRWHGFSSLIKGHSQVLVRKGKVDAAQLRKAHMTQGDLDEDLRSNGVASASDVAEARLERSGRLSVLKKA